MTQSIYFLLLIFSITAEVVGTTALKLSDGFTKWIPATIAIAGYASAFYSLSFILRVVPVGVAYAIWSGVGNLLVLLIGYYWFDQRLNPMVLLGIALIVIGVVVVNIFAKDYFH